MCSKAGPTKMIIENSRLSGGSSTPEALVTHMENILVCGMVNLGSYGPKLSIFQVVA